MQVLAAADRNRELLQHKGSLAAQRISAAFYYDGYRRTVNETYGVVLRRFRRKTIPGDNQTRGEHETENPDAEVACGINAKKLALAHKIIRWHDVYGKNRAGYGGRGILFSAIH